MSLTLADPKFRVAICGAGIGGLALAVTIGKFADQDIRIDLYEAHDAITAVGAGIVIPSRTLDVMRELGIYEEISRISTKPLSPSHVPIFRRSNIPQGGFDWFQQIPTIMPSNLQRQHLVDIFKQYLPSSCSLHFNKRLTRYDKQLSGSLILHFADDTTSTTDVLIGADGVHSSVRKTLFESLDRDIVDPSMIRHYTDPSWTGTLVYRTVVPAEKLSDLDPNNIALKNFVVFCGMGKHVVSYLVAQGTLINVVASVTDGKKAGTPFEGRWVSSVSHEEVQEIYRDFEPIVQNLLKCCENPSRWALHVVNELPLFVYERVALIGDACHAMTPHFGAGAGQAMEDAFVLGRLLAHPLTTLDNVPAALKVYQDVRLPFAQFVARESARAGLLYDFDMSSAARENVQEELDIQKEKLLVQWEWEGKDSLVGEWLEAERKLQESTGVLHGLGTQ
ncbi:FAD/NAD(P)-binding domain-containing protein [Suillus decipiens]|nr:FAD/NAD(P)-binding domain-containing protein [Suillus decipiens]